MPRIKAGLGIILMGLLSLAALLCAVEAVAWGDRFRTAPTTNTGKKWRIGYYEGGPYTNYPANLIALAQGLAELGWMKDRKIKEIADPTDTKDIWIRLGESKSNYLQFVQDAFYSANWDDALRTKNKAAIISRLRAKELDFMIAMGTWAGQDLANNQHHVPIIVVSSSDPVKSGIVKSVALSGFDHVHAKCDPSRYIRQIKLFHDIVGFKRLGVVYDNTAAGKSYAALGDIEKVAARRGFKLVACEAPWSGENQQAITKKLIDCHKALAPHIDALFLTVHNGVVTRHMNEILAPLMDYKIPTWSQRGPEEVRDGVLLSVSRAGFKAVGKYHARIMAKIFNGARPGSLNQIFEDPQKIVINLKTARAIGFKIPKGLIKVADEIFK